MRHSPGTSKRDRPLLSVTAQVFTLDSVSPSAAWIEQTPLSTPVHLYHDCIRRMYRLISVHGSKPVLNLSVSRSLILNKASSKFLQLVDQRNAAVFGLGFSDERELIKFTSKLTEILNLLNDDDSETDTPKTRRDDEHLEDDAVMGGDEALRIENARLKGALAESCTNATKWERELTVLKEVNKTLTEALKAKPTMDNQVEKGRSTDRNAITIETLLQRITESLDNSQLNAVVLDKLQELQKLLRNAAASMNSLNDIRFLHDEMAKKLHELDVLHNQIGCTISAATQNFDNSVV